MAAWFTVYCARSTAAVSADDILASINAADVWTVAEGFGIEDDDAVEAACNVLQIEPISDQPGLRFRLSYRPPEFRPVIVHVWDDAEQVQEELEEADELLEDASGAGLGRIRAHLGRVTEVVAVELGWSQMEDMGVVLANLVAEFLAGAADGLMVDPMDAWWAVEGGVPVQLAGPTRQAEPGAAADGGGM
jgi:hypothetical protein